MASAFWWASQTVARLLSTELSFLSEACHFWRDEGLPDRASPWLLVPLLPSTLGGLQGMTAPPQGALVLQEETWGVYATYKLPGRAPAVPPWMSLAPPAEWQVCPPLGSAEASSANGPSGQFIWPLSTLQWLHARTFHILSPCNMGCPLPISPGSLGRTLHPLFSPFLKLTSAHQQLTT